MYKAELETHRATALFLKCLASLKINGTVLSERKSKVARKKSKRLKSYMEFKF